MTEEEDIEEDEEQKKVKKRLENLQNKWVGKLSTEKQLEETVEDFAIPDDEEDDHALPEQAATDQVTGRVRLHPKDHELIQKMVQNTVRAELQLLRKQIREEMREEMERMRVELAGELGLEFERTRDEMKYSSGSSKKGLFR